LLNLGVEPATLHLVLERWRRGAPQASG
jgi:hypothetical protein